MNTDIKPEVIKRTQELLGRHIKKPPLTEKLLRKPPFRFLHDIITSVIRGTGFLDGVLSSEEMNHENIKDKEGKIAFLQKVIDAVGAISGVQLTARPTKIVAGHEPTKTNEFLQAIGKSLDDKRKGIEPQPGNTAKKITLTTNKTPTSKQPTPEAPSKSKTVATPKSVKPQPAQPQEKSKPKEIDKKKPTLKTAKSINSKPMKTSQSTEIITGGASPQKKTERQATVSDPMGEMIDNENNKEAETVDLVDESLESTKREEEAVHSYPIQPPPQDLEMKRPPSAHLRQRQASAVKPLGGTLNDAIAKNAEELTTLVTEGIDQSTEKVPARRPMSVRPPTARPASARPAAPRIRDRGDVPRVEEPSIVTGKVNVITDNDTSQDQDEDNFLIVESKQTVVVEDKTTVNIQPTADGPHGHLVAQILETQKDLEEKANLRDANKDTSLKKTDIEWEGGRKQDRLTVIVKQEVDQLRNVIQKATSVVNPLGKLMDYVQEDVDAMQRELETWRDTNRQLSIQLRDEQMLTDQAIQPMKLQLDQLEESIREKRDQISSLKATLLHNDARIKQLLVGDAGSAH